MSQIKIHEERRRQAIEILVELGAVSYFSDLDLYHGRAGDGSGWEVKTNFNNAGNATGNRNVNKVSGLYVAEEKIATEFAKTRATQLYGTQPEVYKIVSTDKDSVLFNTMFNRQQLSLKDQLRYDQAMKDLTLSTVTQGNPIKFEHREAWKIVMQYLQKYSSAKDSWKSEWCNNVINELKKNPQIQQIFKFKSEDLKHFVYDVVGSINAQEFMKKYSTSVIHAYISGEDQLQNYPINSSYISAWCDANHIVGIQQKVSSATLQKNIDTCHIFNIKKIKEEKQYGQIMARVVNNYGAVTTSLKKVIKSKKDNEFLVNATPSEIMERIKQDKHCKELYEMDSGVWENWTVGQHTEAVIDFFDRYFADSVPEELIPFLKVTMLAHDIGKGVDVKNGKRNSPEAMEQSKHLFKALGIEKDYAQLIKFVISDSQQFTSSVLLTGKPKLINNLSFKKACENAIIDAFGRVPTKAEVDAFKRVCIVLQQCDSGAYTYYAQVREGNKNVTGGNERFTNSFILDENNNPRLRNFEGVPIDNI